MEAYLIGYAIGVVILGAMFGALGAWIAGQKGREATEGAVLGFLFGPLGCLIEALLPAKPAALRKAAVRSRPAVRQPRSTVSVATPADDVDDEWLGIVEKPKPTTNEEWLDSQNIE